MSRRSDVKQFIQVLKGAGIKARIDGGTHYGLWIGDQRVGTLPYTPSDWRWRQNTIRDIRLTTGIDLRQNHQKRIKSVSGA